MIGERLNVLPDVLTLRPAVTKLIWNSISFFIFFFFFYQPLSLR